MAPGWEEATVTGLAVLDADVTAVVASDKLVGEGRGGPTASTRTSSPERGRRQLLGRPLDHGEERGAARITRYGGDDDEAQLALSDEVFGIDVVPGMRLRVRMQVEGASPTSLRGRVWKDGEPEPSSWLVEASDATPALQTAGALALKAYLSTLAPNAPVTIAFDDFDARPLGCR